MLITMALPGGISKVDAIITPISVDTKENKTENTIVEKKELATSKEAIGGMDMKDVESMSPTAFIDSTMFAQANAIKE